MEKALETTMCRFLYAFSNVVHPLPIFCFIREWGQAVSDLWTFWRQEMPDNNPLVQKRGRKLNIFFELKVQRAVSDHCSMRSITACT